jgi:hypothetical protein
MKRPPLPGDATRYRLLLALACASLALPALAQDYPKLKPGLWEIKRSSDRAQGLPSLTICMDDAIQRDMFTAGLDSMKSMCSKTDFKITGSRGVGEFVCNLNGTTVTSKSVMTLTGDTGWRTEVDNAYEPHLNGQSRTHAVIEGRYAGACKPGQRPGDAILPNGQTINIREQFGGPKK